ncbi:MAG: ABC transporter ATP-binding protein [Anaerolineae bacterium]|nr:ABC transporter ATP-binding protein [Anaerolineae bacterium]NUQ02410.1 ABC transporter ATP-binding protein [Anaerolineae bacterium]
MNAQTGEKAYLHVSGVTKRFGVHIVLSGIDLAIDSGEIICLLGPSGCGKTTLLRVIAGLEAPEEGGIYLGSASVTDQPVHQRGFGLMFQDHTLFPHLNVADNIAFGLKMRGVSAAVQRTRVLELLELIGLMGYERRDPATLSGGEKQRVALARSLAPSPSLLMLDEPLGALDGILRQRLMADLRRIIKQIGLTAIYVTHDRHEAFATADRIAVMNAGRIEQVAAPQDLYRRPATAFAAQFIGLRNVFPVLSMRDGRAATIVGEFTVTNSPGAILIHPGGIRLVDSPRQGGYILPAKIGDVTYAGSAYLVRVMLDSSASLWLELSSYNAAPPQAGAEVSIYIEPDAVIPLGMPR